MTIKKRAGGGVGGRSAPDVNELASLFRAAFISVSTIPVPSKKPKSNKSISKKVVEKVDSDSDSDSDSDFLLSSLPKKITKSIEKLKELGFDVGLLKQDDLLQRANARRELDEKKSKKMNPKGGNVLWTMRKRILELEFVYRTQGKNGSTPQINKKPVLDTLRTWAYYFVIPPKVIDIVYEGRVNPGTKKDEDVEELLKVLVNLTDDFYSGNPERGILRKRLLRARIEIFLNAEWRDERKFPSKWTYNVKVPNTIKYKKIQWTTNDLLTNGFDENAKAAWNWWFDAIGVRDIFDDNTPIEDRRLLWRNANIHPRWTDRKTLSDRIRDEPTSIEIVKNNFFERFVVVKHDEEKITHENDSSEVRRAFLLRGEDKKRVIEERNIVRGILKACDKITAEETLSMLLEEENLDFDFDDDDTIDGLINAIGFIYLSKSLNDECDMFQINRRRRLTSPKHDDNDDNGDDDSGSPSSLSWDSDSSDSDSDSSDSDSKTPAGPTAPDTTESQNKWLKEQGLDGLVGDASGVKKVVDELWGAWIASDKSRKQEAKRIVEGTNQLAAAASADGDFLSLQLIIGNVIRNFGSENKNRKLILENLLRERDGIKWVANDLVMSEEGDPDERAMRLEFTRELRVRMVAITLLTDEDMETMLKYMPTDDLSGNSSGSPPSYEETICDPEQGNDHCVTQYETLADFNERGGFEVIGVRADGHCFFRAIAEALGHQQEHLGIRQEAVNMAMATITPDIAFLLDEAWERSMRGNGWADEFVLVAATKTLGVCLEVYKQRFEEDNETEKPVSFSRHRPSSEDKCDEGNTIVLLNTGPGNGVHFDLLKKKKTPEGGP